MPRVKVLERLFFCRPRILNVLHAFYLVEATSQTNSLELAALARYAAGAKSALEIGSYQGVSATVIARNLAPDGRLFCVDPWPSTGGRSNPGFKIFKRHLRRTKTVDRIDVVRNYSGLTADQLPDRLDFAFIDGDHSWPGIETDWHLVAPRLFSGGIVCLHDTAIPEAEPWRKFDSTRFYDERIATDAAFETISTVYSMRVVRKL